LAVQCDELGAKSIQERNKMEDLELQIGRKTNKLEQKRAQLKDWCAKDTTTISEIDNEITEL